MDSGARRGGVRASLLFLSLLALIISPAAGVDPLAPVRGASQDAAPDADTRASAESSAAVEAPPPSAESGAAGEAPLSAGTGVAGNAPQSAGVGAAPDAHAPAAPDVHASAAPGVAPAAPANADALPQDVRAIWVVRDALADPEPERIVAYAQELGANTLFVQVSGRGDAWYDSDILPRAEQLQEKRGDPFARLMAAARTHGLSVHAWINVGLVWSGRKLPEDPKHVLRSHPEWIACLPDGAPIAAVPQDSLLAWYVEGVFAELWHAGYRKHVASVAREILERYDIDGVHLDYIRRPVIDTGYDVETVGRFLQRSGRVAWEFAPVSLRGMLGARVVTVGDGGGDDAASGNGGSGNGGSGSGSSGSAGSGSGGSGHAAQGRAASGDAVASGPVPDLRHRPSGRAWYPPRRGAAHPARTFRWPDYSDAVTAPAELEWNRYRREAVTLAVAAVRAVVDDVSTRDGRKRVLTAAVMPDPARAQKRFAQDWALWVDSGLLDYVVPMCYAAGREAAAEQIALTLEAVPADRVIAGVGAYQQTLGACALTVRDMLEKDVRGVCIFSWGSLDEKREKERAQALVRRAWMPVEPPRADGVAPADAPGVGSTAPLETPASSLLSSGESGDTP